MRIGTELNYYGTMRKCVLQEKIAFQLRHFILFRLYRFFKCSKTRSVRRMLNYYFPFAVICTRLPMYLITDSNTVICIGYMKCTKNGLSRKKRKKKCRNLSVTLQSPKLLATK